MLIYSNFMDIYSWHWTSILHMSSASCILIPIFFSVYYASGTSIAKFPPEGVIITHNLQNQGKFVQCIGVSKACIIGQRNITWTRAKMASVL